MERARSISESGYQPYMGDRIAGFSPMQTAAADRLAGYQNPWEMGAASAAAGHAAAGFGSFNPTASTVSAPTGYSSGLELLRDPAMVSPQQISPSIRGPSINTGVGSFDSATAQRYMSPYQQNVTDIQKREAMRNADMATTGRNSALVSKGAFGGTRQAVIQAEADRNLQTQLGDIDARGLQSSYDNAQQQFERDRTADLQTQLANQGNTRLYDLAGQQTGLQALMANQGIDLQAQLANQRTGTQNNQFAADLQQGWNRFMGGNDMQAALANQQAGLQLNSQQLQALQGMLGAGNLYGNLGGQQQSMFMDRNQALYGMGTNNQNMMQQILDMQYSDFVNARDFPRQNLSFYSGIMHGTPVSPTQEVSQFNPAPNPMSTLGGLGAIALGSQQAGAGAS